MNEDQKKLIARIEALEKWKEGKMRQQITLPLDPVSISVLQTYFMRITGERDETSATGNTFITYVGSQGTRQFAVIQNTVFPYIVNTTTDIFTVASGRFINDQQVIVSTSDTAPSPLVAGTIYFIINSADNGTTFQLSGTSGGAAINVTDTGTGAQYISLI